MPQNMPHQDQKNHGQTPLKLTRFFSNGIVIMVISFLIVIFTLNAVFMEPLFLLGVNVIHDMQVGFVSKVFQVFMNIFSLICNTPIIAVIFLLEIGLVKHKLKALVHLSFFLIGFHIIAILKQAYQQSRPIWVSTQINKYEWFCPTDFGNPSGHSYVAFPLFEPIIDKYFGFNRWKVAWIFLILFGVVVPYSRMYLGVHSMNQVFFGLSFGVAWTLLYRYGLRKMFYQVFSRMLKLKKATHLSILILMHIILTIIPIIIFKVRSDNTPLPAQDLANLNKICESSISSVDIQQKMLLICILHAPVFGFFYGFFALKCTEEDKLYFSGQWSYRDYTGLILHCATQVISAGTIPVIVILGFGSIWNQSYSQFFIFNASLVLGGFIYIWLTPKLERKYEWIKYNNENDIYAKDTGQNLDINKIDTLQTNYEITLKKNKRSP